MIEAYIKPVLEQKMHPLLQRLSLSRCLTPNAVTLIGLAFGLCIFLALWQQQVALALLCLALSGCCDMLDGMLARARQTSSAIGTVLDIVADRLVEVSVILGLVVMALPERAWLGALMLASILICVTSFLVVGIFTDNDSEKSFYYSPGLMERPEAFAFFAMMMIFPALFSLLAGLFIVLVTWTGLYRVGQFVYAQSKMERASGS